MSACAKKNRTLRKGCHGTHHGSSYTMRQDPKVIPDRDFHRFYDARMLPVLRRCKDNCHVLIPFDVLVSKRVIQDTFPYTLCCWLGSILSIILFFHLSGYLCSNIYTKQQDQKAVSVRYFHKFYDVFPLLYLHKHKANRHVLTLLLVFFCHSDVPWRFKTSARFASRSRNLLWYVQ